FHEFPAETLDLLGKGAGARLQLRNGLPERHPPNARWEAEFGRARAGEDRPDRLVVLPGKGDDGPDSLIIDRPADEFDPSTGHLPQVPPEGIKRLRAAGLDDEPHRLERPTPLQEPQEGGA